MNVFEKVFTFTYQTDLDADWVFILLLQGADVWLYNRVIPQEAFGCRIHSLCDISMGYGLKTKLLIAPSDGA